MKPNIITNTIAVFCGSKPGENPAFETDALALGKALAENGYRIIYGGGNKGLMGAVANSALAGGGFITGVIPEMLVKWERQHDTLSELIITENMHQRKQMMYERCEAAIVLPGGFGTLDELFEMLTWNQLQIHDKKILLLNTAGFYFHLMEHLRNMQEMGFLYEETTKSICLCNSVGEVIDQLRLRN